MMCAVREYVDENIVMLNSRMNLRNNVIDAYINI